MMDTLKTYVPTIMLDSLFEISCHKKQINKLLEHHYIHLSIMIKAVHLILLFILLVLELVQNNLKNS